MYYLNLDLDGYLLSISSTPMPDCPTLESLDGLNLSGCRIGAYRWDGTALTLDKARLAQLEAEQAAAEKAERDEESRAAAMAEVQAALVTAQIDTLAVDDATALRWRLLYPVWSPDGVQYNAGDKRQRGDKLYRCLQGHTSQPDWAPELAPSLWTEINETHAGTIDDPIPYSGNMALAAGKYYSQGGVTYRCTRDTINPVYNALADLVGLYVEVAEI